jgi:hypothetical protein
VDQHGQGVRLDLVDRPQRPHGHLRILGRIGRRERAAVLTRQVEVDGERLVQHEAVVVDRRHVAVRIDLEERRRPRVEHPLGVLRGEAVALHHRLEPERDAELVREPDVARGARAVDAVDGEHAGPPVYLPR